MPYSDLFSDAEKIQNLKNEKHELQEKYDQ
jgi:hypothetical protein